MKIREVNILEHVLKNDTGVSVPHNLRQTRYPKKIIEIMLLKKYTRKIVKQ